MNARHQAYQLLYATLKKGQYLNLGLKEANLTPQDRSFVTRLVNDALQNYDWMKYQYQEFLVREVPLEVEIILVMSCVQHFLMDSVEDYANVNEAVNLVKEVKPSYSGLVNAVLKKVIQNPLKDSDDLSIRYSHPSWMVNLFKKQLGEVAAMKLLAHNNTIAPLYVRVHQDEAIEKYELTKQDGYYVGSGKLLGSDALESGALLIQDKASQQVVEMFDEISGRILDACGAPGTKCSQLALRFPQADITMLDIHPHRVKLAQDLMGRLGIENVNCIVGDATNYVDEPFDAILCDVPCSGLGVLRRKPDLRFRIQPEDLDSLEQLQADILDHVDTLLKPGGQLVYATCTLNRKENELQIQKFLRRTGNYVLVREQLILPPEHNSDGFYMALLVKSV